MQAKSYQRGLNLLAVFTSYYIVSLMLSSASAETCEQVVTDLNSDYMQGVDGAGVWESVAYPDSPMPNSTTHWPSLSNPDNATSWSNLFAVSNTVYNNNYSWPVYQISKDAPIAGMIANAVMLSIRCAFPLDAQTDQRLGSRCGYPFASMNNTGGPTCPDAYSATQFIKGQTGNGSWASRCCSLPRQSLQALREIQAAIINGTVHNSACGGRGAEESCYTFSEVIVNYNPAPALLRAFFTLQVFYKRRYLNSMRKICKIFGVIKWVRYCQS